MKEYQEGRRRELAKIYIAKKQLGLDEATYREMLYAVGGARSASQLSPTGRKAVLRRMEECGFKPTRGKKPHPGQPHNFNNAERGGLLRRIEAHLAEFQLPWSYADAISLRMFKVERVAWCKPGQLYKIAQALECHAKRGARKARKV